MNVSLSWEGIERDLESIAGDVLSDGDGRLFNHLARFFLKGLTRLLLLDNHSINENTLHVDRVPTKHGIWHKNENG